MSQWHVIMLALSLSLLIGTSVAAPTLQPAVQAFFELQNSRNCSGWVAQFNDTFVVRDPRASDPVRSKADLLAQCEGGLQLFTTIALIPERAYPSGDGAAVEWGCYSVAQGRDHTCRLNFTGVDVFLTTDDGTKITEMTGYFDDSIPGAQLAPCT